MQNLRLLLIVLLLITACQGSRKVEVDKNAPKREYNSMERYVHTPLDKANAASKINDDRNHKLNDQLKQVPE